MSDHKDYSSILNKARRRRKRRWGWDPRLLLMIAGAVLALALIIFAGFQISRAVSGSAGNGPDSPAATPSDAVPAQDSQVDEAAEAARQPLTQAVAAEMRTCRPWSRRRCPRSPSPGRSTAPICGSWN